MRCLAAVALFSAACGTEAKNQCSSDGDCLDGDRCAGGTCQGNTVEGCGQDHVTCGALATCTTVGDALACACNAGYVGDGQTCKVDMTTLHVSPTGADDNDGFLAPVRTLNQAIALATNDGGIVGIELAEGRYDKLLGEQFPYTVPTGVTLRGPSSGAAVLVGAGDTAGLVFGASQLEHVELEGFTIALDAVAAGGSGTLDTVQVRSSATGLQLEPNAIVTARALDLHAAEVGVGLGGHAALTVESLAIDSKVGVELGDAAALTAQALALHVSATGAQVGGHAALTATGMTIDLSASASHQIGVNLDAAATLTATDLASTGLPTHVAVGPGAQVKLTAPHLQGGGTGITGGFAAVVEVVDGVIAAGTIGVHGEDAAGDQPQITLTRTTISGASMVGFKVGHSTAHITGGEIRNNGIGLDLELSYEGPSGETVTLDGVKLTANTRAAWFEAVYHVLPVTIRGSTFEGNTSGIFLDAATIDLGTAASPGNNVLRSGIDARYTAPVDTSYIINAVGNTWTPSTQGADADGHYASQTIIGPTSGSNFTLEKSDGDITNPNPPQWRLML